MQITELGENLRKLTLPVGPEKREGRGMMSAR